MCHSITWRPARQQLATCRMSPCLVPVSAVAVAPAAAGRAAMTLCLPCFCLWLTGRAASWVAVLHGEQGVGGAARGGGPKYTGVWWPGDASLNRNLSAPCGPSCVPAYTWGLAQLCKAAPPPADAGKSPPRRRSPHSADHVASPLHALQATSNDPNGDNSVHTYVGTCKANSASGAAAAIVGFNARSLPCALVVCCIGAVGAIGCGCELDSWGDTQAQLGTHGTGCGQRASLAVVPEAWLLPNSMAHTAMGCPCGGAPGRPTPLTLPIPLPWSHRRA